MMYEKIGILCDDKVGWMIWFMCNYNFFNVLVVLFFVFDEWVGYGQWGYIGMLM